MGLLNIAPATRAGAHLLISLYGPPESGKTMTALRLARGMAGPGGKIGFLDTEAGRGRLYADAVPGGYDIGELSAPFTAQRYVEAIRQFEEAGYPVLIIDSFSHVWQGEGGVLEQAERGGGKGLQKWLAPKLAYKKLMNALLGTRMHIIFCSRAKQPMVEGVDATGKATLIPGPWVEIQDKNLRYEMTVVLEMQGQGRFEIRKCPGPIRHLFPADRLVDEAMGATIAEWVSGGEPVNPVLERLKVRAQDQADQGTPALLAFWDFLEKSERALLKPHMENYKSMARAVDLEQERQQTEQRNADGLDDPFAPAGNVVSIAPAATVDEPTPKTRADLCYEIAKLGTAAGVSAWMGDRDADINALPEADQKHVRAEANAQWQSLSAKEQGK